MCCIRWNMVFRQVHMVFGKNIHWVIGMLDIQLFKGGWATHAASWEFPQNKLVCHGMSYCMSPSGKSQLSYILHEHEASRDPTYCIIQQDSVHASPLKAMRTVYQTQFQGYENTAYLSSPNVWVKELDWLCLPHTVLYGI